MKTTKCLDRYADIIILVFSLIFIVSGGFLFAEGIAKSQSKVKIANKCQDFYSQKYDNINSDYESVAEINKVEIRQFNDQIQNCIDFDSVGMSEFFLWIFSFIFIVAGIVGVVFIGHRFSHELKHVSEPTLGRLDLEI